MGTVPASLSANASWCSKETAQGLDLRKEEGRTAVNVSKIYNHSQ